MTAYSDMSPAERFRSDASNTRFGNANSCVIQLLPNGLYSLHTPGHREVIAVGTWAELEAAFATRPKYIPPVRAVVVPEAIRGLNLEIRL